MAEKITVSPSEVRGYGNIAEERHAEDYIVDGSQWNVSLEEGSDEIGGITAGACRMALHSYTLAFSVHSATAYYGDSIPFSCTLLCDGEPAIGETVRFRIAGYGPFAHVKTDSSGVASTEAVPAHSCNVLCEYHTLTDTCECHIIERIDDGGGGGDVIDEQA